MKTNSFKSIFLLIFINFFFLNSINANIKIKNIELYQNNINYKFSFEHNNKQQGNDSINRDTIKKSKKIRRRKNRRNLPCMLKMPIKFLEYSNKLTKLAKFPDAKNEIVFFLWFIAWLIYIIPLLMVIVTVFIVAIVYLIFYISLVSLILFAITIGILLLLSITFSMWVFILAGALSFIFGSFLYFFLISLCVT